MHINLGGTAGLLLLVPEYIRDVFYLEVRIMDNQLVLTAKRIAELRNISGKSVEDMAILTGITSDEYIALESGTVDFPFTFLHKCAKAFGVDIADLLTGENPKLSGYTIARRGQGVPIARRNGFKYNHLATYFKNRMAEPFHVTVPYNAEDESRPIKLSTHTGEEFDYVLKGSLKIQIGKNIEYIGEGDFIYYNSSTPHGMVAANGEDCEFLAVVMDAEGKGMEYSAPVEQSDKAVKSAVKSEDKPVWADFIEVEENDMGGITKIDFKNSDSYNFGYDVVDAIAEKNPEKLAMLHLDKNKNERRFTFEDIRRLSNKAANYFLSLGIKKGDRVMLVLKRHYQFWISFVALHKIGAIAVPATNQLVKKDFVYRFQKGEISAIICTADGDVYKQVELAECECPELKTKIIVGADREDWRSFDSEFENFSDSLERAELKCNEPALMFFSSGTTGYPKIVTHAHTYSLGHFITAKYWHNVSPDGLHFTISDTGWGKALWGKLYGQWLCEAAVFTYDFDRFSAEDILPLFKKYNITTFCAPPTMYRFFIKEDLSKYDLSSLVYSNTAGEALNPEVYNQWKKATGLDIMEGFGQTETTLVICNQIGDTPKPGSMGKPSPLYNVDIVGPDNKPVAAGETGEIVVYTEERVPYGLFLEYYNDPENTEKTWNNNIFHTGDTAWKDEDGYFWYVGRVDDLIKSSGYRIGPFEIESVIMELPYVLECAVTAAPDPVRGQVVKATIVLTKGTTASDELKKEVQNYVKTHTAPYKYPRIVEFVEELPKTISGKIRRVEIRKNDGESK